ncbi:MULTISPECIES: phosphatase PAP2 family protein [unclassified Xanthomonas]|uniref:acid phosphatase n=1 Tax=unclassified Xanthomonas TaxID=2643310 RepID=UPI001264F97F|nr:MULTISPECIES: phosphatase PAP2 family protein [unclassified Xanthomonas]KAB7776836.1 phosphatase [Xanthomonas sp. LMG 12460]MDY4295844.1 phosphatase PAP2 family protein [Xanthomonas sp. LF02-5]MDY4357639.1 phosphatase PAP2 family protein [Xanthomonas sp. LF04-12]
MPVSPACRVRSVAVVLALALAACSGPALRAPAPAPAPAKAVGYLPAAAVPDSLQLLPAPPAADSPGEALDMAINREALALRGSARWQQAARDADLSFPNGAGQFACALDVAIDAQHTPHLYTLLERSRIDASAATKAAKRRYQRARPFLRNAQAVCTPGDLDDLRQSGSYPSGHSAIGWAWALILSEIAPERATALIARGRNYGESRLVCNVHWQSDVLAGRFIGAATVARLHDDAAFRADLAAARGEIAAARAAGRMPAGDCTAENEVLQVRPASAL